MSRVTLPIGSYFSKTQDGQASIYRIGDKFFRSDESEIRLIDDNELQELVDPNDEEQYEYDDEPSLDDEDYEPWEDEFIIPDEGEINNIQAH